MWMRDVDWAARRVVEGLAERVASARAAWRASGLEFTSFAAKAIVKEQVRSRDAVVASFVRRGHQPDAIAREHRAVYRKVARREMASIRFLCVGLVAFLAVTVALCLGVRSYFGDRFGVLETLLLAAGGFLVVALPGLLIAGVFSRLPLLGVSPSAAIAEQVAAVFWVWLLAALLGALAELDSGRTLFDRMLELLSRLPKR